MRLRERQSASLHQNGMSCIAGGGWGGMGVGAERSTGGRRKARATAGCAGRAFLVANLAVYT